MDKVLKVKSVTTCRDIQSDRQSVSVTASVMLSIQETQIGGADRMKVRVY